MISAEDLVDQKGVQAALVPLIGRNSGAYVVAVVSVVPALVVGTGWNWRMAKTTPVPLPFERR